MPVVTVGDMLNKAGEFEKKLEDFYADLRDRTTNDGVRMLTYYLARHKRHLPEALGLLAEGEVDAVRRMPFKDQDLDLVPAEHFKGLALASDAKAEELLVVAIGLVETLIGFYKRLSEKELGEEAKQLFTNLVKIEETDIIELKKIQAMNYF